MLRVNEEQLCSFPEVVMKAQQNKLGGYPACACTQTQSRLSDLPGIMVRTHTHTHTKDGSRYAWDENRMMTKKMASI